MAKRSRGLDDTLRTARRAFLPLGDPPLMLRTASAQVVVDVVHGFRVRGRSGPRPPLISASDGKFYGTTWAGGTTTSYRLLTGG